MTSQSKKEQERVDTAKQSVPSGRKWLKVCVAAFVGFGFGIPSGGLGWKMLHPSADIHENPSPQPPTPRVSLPPDDPQKAESVPTAELDEMQKAKSAQDAEIAALKSSNDASTRDLDGLRKEIAELKTASLRLTGQLTDLQQKDKAATQLIETNQEEISKLQTDHQSLTTQLNVAVDEKRKAVDGAKADKDVIEKFKSDFEVLKVQLKDAMSSNESLAEQVRNLTPNIRVEADLDVFNSDPKKRINIIYKNGKRQEAEGLCKILGFKFSENDVLTDLHLIEATFADKISVETLAILQTSKSIVQSATSPSNPLNGSPLQSSFLGVPHLCPMCIGALPNTICDQLTDYPEVTRTFIENRWALTQCNLPNAWAAVFETYNLRMSKRGPLEPTIVAVIDKGFQVDHPELDGHLWHDPNDSNVHGVRFRGSSKPDFNISPNPTDDLMDRAHGTHVASQIIYAGIPRFHSMYDGHTDPSGKGAISCVKVMLLAADSETDIALALRWAVKKGAKVVNISMAFPYSPKKTTALDEAIKVILDGRPADGGDEAIPKKDVLIVCAAGNYPKIRGMQEASNGKNNREEMIEASKNNDNTTLFPPVVPCSYGNCTTDTLETFPKAVNDSIISVAAVDKEFTLTDYSHFGKISVDLAAPGGRRSKTDSPEIADPNTNIMGAVPYLVAPNPDELVKGAICPNAKRGSLSGTSQAAPLVAGSAALLWSLYPKMSAMDIKQLLLENAAPKDHLKDKCVSGGVLDMSFVNAEFLEPLRQEERKFSAHFLVGRRSDDLDKAFWQGTSAFRSGNIQEAVVLFETSLKAGDSDRAEPYYFLALALAHQGDMKAADGRLLTALKRELNKQISAADWGTLMQFVQGRQRYGLESVRRQFLSFQTLHRLVKDAPSEAAHSALWDMAMVSYPPTGVPLLGGKSSLFLHPERCLDCGPVMHP